MKPFTLVTSNVRSRLLFGTSCAMALWLGAVSQAVAIDLKQAVQVAIDSNPQVNQAIQNKEAVEFELKQARGLYLPRVDLELSAGARKLENPSRRLLGLDKDTLSPIEAGVSLQQVLFDGGYRRAEVERQASRTDAAQMRIGERSEFIALETVREYLNYMLQQRITAAAQDNAAFHQTMVSDLGEGVRTGSISIADQQQAEERLQASRARVLQAREDLVNAIISFSTRTGLTLDQVSLPPQLALPASLDAAVGLARTNNPRVKIALGDVDAAHAVVREAKAAMVPKVSLELRGRHGDDLDGFRGDTTDLQALIVMRWSVFNGGVNSSIVQEQVRRTSEQRYMLHQVTREAEEDVRTAWNRREQQGAIMRELEQQNRISNELLGSYTDQFRVGRRSLLDVLDAQNTRYNSLVLQETARFAELFAQYKLLASTGQLLDTMGVVRPMSATAASSRTRFDVAATPAAELMERRHPN